MYKTKVKLFDEFLRLNLTILKYFLDFQTIIARVAELVDALDSKFGNIYFTSVFYFPVTPLQINKILLFLIYY